MTVPVNINHVSANAISYILLISLVGIVISCFCEAPIIFCFSSKHFVPLVCFNEVISLFVIMVVFLL